MKNSLMMVTTFLLIGCGGGGGSTARSITAPTTTTAAPTPAPITKTTALVDNKVPATTKFQQFETYLPQLPNKTAQFKDANIYMKVYVTDEQALYLGRYDPTTRLGLHLPNHVKSVKIDIFSATPTDPQFTEEIKL